MATALREARRAVGRTGPCPSALASPFPEKRDRLGERELLPGESVHETAAADLALVLKPARRAHDVAPGKSAALPGESAREAPALKEP